MKGKMTSLNIYKLPITYQLLLFLLFVLFFGVSCNGQSKQNATSTEPSKTPPPEVKKDIEDVAVNQLKDGEKDGLWRAFHKNGLLKSESNYVAGLKEGIHREWDDSGVLLVEGQYANGKANGLMKWFHEHGQLAGEGNMVDDIREGPWKICDIQENGFCIDAFFTNGKRDGVWKIYHDQTRTKIWKEQTFKDDEVIAEKCWNDEGKVIICK